MSATPRQLLDVRAHQRRAQRAVEADGKRLRMAHRVPERLGRLARERAARGVGDRAGDDERQAHAARLEVFVDREQRGLGVERVEDGLDQQQVDAAVDQRGHRFGVGGHQLVEADVAKARIVDVGRDRGGAVGRTEHAGDEARLLRRFRCPGVGAFAGKPGSGKVDLAHPALQLVVGLRDARRVEGVGLDDVGAGFEKGVVDRAHDLGLGQREQVVVALEVARVPAEAASLGPR